MGSKTFDYTFTNPGLSQPTAMCIAASSQSYHHLQVICKNMHMRGFVFEGVYDRVSTN